MSTQSGSTGAAEARDGGRGGPSHPRIVLAQPDAYLAFLIHQQFPDAVVSEAMVDGDIDSLLVPRPDLVILNMENAASGELLRRLDGIAVVGMVEGARVADPGVLGVDHLLLRPFLPGELHRVILEALGMPGDSPREGASRLTHVRSLAGIARLAAVVLAGVLVSPGRLGVSPRVNAYVAAAFAYAALRLVIGRRGVVPVISDAAAAAILLALTGGATGGFAPFAFVVALTVGVEMGSLAGGLVGFAAGLGSVAHVVEGIRAGRFSPLEASAWFALFALTGMAGGAVARVAGTDNEGTTMLAEANRVLSTLYRIARTMPSGLDIGSVAASVLAEIRESLAAPAGVLLINEVGTMAVAGSFGLARQEALSGDIGELRRLLNGGVRAVERSELPVATAEALGDYPCFLVAPLRRDTEALGLLVCVCPQPAHHNRNCAFLRELAEETAVAIENAQLFTRVRELSIDEERQRLARELHDGVAQALTHLRLELDFMARFGGIADERLVNDLARLSRVVDRAGYDVRDMIVGLRSPVTEEGLAGALRSYVRDMKGMGGPELSFDVMGIARAHPEVEAEIFRITQEAVSNALRHAQAKRVRVVLSAGRRSLRLRVEDDGIGIGSRTCEPDHGFGLRGMEQRAERIGATVALVNMPTGGTRVEVEYVLPEKAIASDQEVRV